MSSQFKAHCAVFSTNLFFAINYTVIKYFTLNGIAGPFGINFLRVAGCVLLFWFMFLFKKEKTVVRRRDLTKLVVCAVAAIAANQMLFIKGLSLSSPMHASLLTLTAPVLITIFAAFILKEKLTAVKVFGLLLALGGAAFLLSGKEHHPGDNYVLGDLLILGSAAAYAYYFILVKPLMSRYSAVVVTRWIFTFGLLMIWPFCIPELRIIQFSALDFREWSLLLFMIIPGTFLAYIFNVYGLRILSASAAGTYIYTQPILAGITAVIFLDEHITMNKLVAAVLIFTGLYLAQRSRKKLLSQTADQSV